MTTIPVRNLWLLQLFASDLYRSYGHEFSGIEKLPTDVASLVSRMLADEVAIRFRQGLTVGFNRARADLTRVRGKIDVLGTERHQLLKQGKVRCSFDNIDADTPSNRLIRTALETASHRPGSDSRCSHQASQLAMMGVGTSSAPYPSLRGICRQRHLHRDHRMLMAAHLLLHLSVPSPGSGDSVFLRPDDEDNYLRRLFEKAVFGFYQHQLPSSYAVTHGERLEWPADSLSAGMLSILPGMQTDIVVRHTNAANPRTIIIDTKFTSVLAPNRFNTHRLKSGYLYQIYTYVLTQQDNGRFGPHTEGLMLHPVVDGQIDELMKVQGHTIRFSTVDLRGSYSSITTALLDAVREPRE